MAYEKTKSSVEALCDVLHIPHTSVPPAVVSANPALTPEMAATLRGIKALLGDSPEPPRVVERFHRQYESMFADTYSGDAVYLLSAPTCGEIIRQYADSNENVRRHWFPARNALFGPLQHGMYGRMDTAEGSERAVRFLRAYFPAILSDCGGPSGGPAGKRVPGSPVPTAGYSVEMIRCRDTKKKTGGRFTSLPGGACVSEWQDASSLLCDTRDYLLLIAIAFVPGHNAHALPPPHWDQILS